MCVRDTTVSLLRLQYVASRTISITTWVYNEINQLSLRSFSCLCFVKYSYGIPVAGVLYTTCHWYLYGHGGIGMVQARKERWKC